MFATLAVILCDEFHKCFPSERSQDVAKQVWERDLKEFTDNQLQGAVDMLSKVFKKGHRFNLPYFRDLCEKVRGENKSKLNMRDANYWKCAISGCLNPGNISRELRGDTWICGHHYRNSN